MKKLYWKLSKTAWQIHVLVAIISITALFCVENFKVKIKKPYYNEKIAAAKIMENGMAVIKDYRLKNNIPIDLEVDPMQTGMIGTLISPITSNTGSLDAKLAATNPDWAAIFVEMLKSLNIGKGDVVAAGFSGSFPALNLAFFAAGEAIGIKIIPLTSLAASTWGANNPNLTWLHIEKILYEHKIISNKSIAVSLGGTKDRALGMGIDGKTILKQVIAESGLDFIYEKDETLNIQKRIDLYKNRAEGRHIKAFVNIGGGTISVGTKVGKHLFKPGININPNPKVFAIDSVMSRFAKEEIPIIHITNIRELAEKYHIKFNASKNIKTGKSKLFYSYEYSKTLVIIALFVIVAALYFLIKRDFGSQIFQNANNKKSGADKTPMV